MDQNMAKWIIVLGLVIVFIGVAFYLVGDKLGWIGHLPGDIRIEKKNFKFYFPITTMILFSLLINLILKLIKRLM